MVDPKTSPRRSSRVRQTHPTPSASSHSLSSSSVASSHGERNVRPFKKQQSPQKSATPPSSDGDSAAVKLQLAEPPQTRRRKRGQKSDNEMDGRETVEVEDELIEEEEVTRCVCGQLEYPGPPVEAEESQKAKDGGPQASGGGSGSHADDGGSLFIQCDICKVWQHGGCVGIMNEATSPEEYFCEQCRKDLHQLKLGSLGQKYSRYLPVFEQLYSKSSRKGAPVKDIESKTNKERESAQLSKMESFTKRRSTMNSRAAYDEDEVLRKVIEESKGEGHTVSMDGSTRKGKRSREDSGEQKSNLKRQRTGSTSPHSHGTSNVYPHDGDSDMEAATRKNRNNGRKAKASLPEQGQREIREREKSEAAGRRKGRAERRRVEDYALSESATLKDDVTSQQHEDPDPEQYPVASHPAKSSPQHSSNRQSAQKPSRNSKNNRTGRNQYTKDRDNALLRQVSASPALRNKDHSPPSGKASDTDAGHGDGNLNNSHVEAAPYHSRHAKMRNQRSNLNDMRKRVAGMLEFISRVQVDMAQESPSSAASSGLINSNRSAMTMITATFAAVNGDQTGGIGDCGDEEPPARQQDQKVSSQALAEKPFAELSSLEMMDVLTRKLVRWQKMFGKIGDK